MSIHLNLLVNFLDYIAPVLVDHTLGAFLELFHGIIRPKTIAVVIEPTELVVISALIVETVR